MIKRVLEQLSNNIYIFGVSTETSYSKPLEHNVAYIPITSSSHATSVTSKNMVPYNLIGRWRCSADRRKTACKCFTASILALI